MRRAIFLALYGLLGAIAAMGFGGIKLFLFAGGLLGLVWIGMELDATKKSERARETRN